MRLSLDKLIVVNMPADVYPAQIGLGVSLPDTYVLGEVSRKVPFFFPDRVRNPQYFVNGTGFSPAKPKENMAWGGLRLAEPGYAGFISEPDKIINVPPGLNVAFEGEEKRLSDIVFRLYSLSRYWGKGSEASTKAKMAARFGLGIAVPVALDAAVYFTTGKSATNNPALMAFGILAFSAWVGWGYRQAGNAYSSTLRERETKAFEIGRLLTNLKPALISANLLSE
ncbi:hypothetical protein HYU18_03575 [Candidatus Woesearchaeota archaeon]|nr:hypothetical protein [Candidatus Woesearchaeota archaeon]